MPGAGLRSELHRAYSSTTPSGWYGQNNHASTCAPLREQPGKVGVHFAHVLDAEESASHPGLVRDNCDGKPRSVESRDGLRRAVEQLDPFNRADIPMILDDRAIAIQQDAGTTIVRVCSLRFPPQLLHLGISTRATVGRTPVRCAPMSAQRSPVSLGDWLPREDEPSAVTAGADRRNDTSLGATTSAS